MLNVFNVYLSVKRPAILFAALLGFAGWQGIYLWKYAADAEPAAYLLGDVSRAQYLTRRLPEYPAFDYINRETPAGAKIYLLFAGRTAYYCERDYFHDGGDLPGFLLAAIRAAQNAEQIDQSFRQKQITHLMAREDLLTGFLSNNLTPDRARLWNEFASRRLELSFRARGQGEVYLADGRRRSASAFSPFRVFLPVSAFFFTDWATTFIPASPSIVSRTWRFF